MASISMISAANNCSRRSGEVSTRMRVVALSTMIDALVRRFLGSCGSQAPQSLPMRGTPDEVPHPNMVSFTWRSEEHTSELQSLMRISYAVFCLKKQKNKKQNIIHNIKTDSHT